MPENHNFPDFSNANNGEWTEINSPSNGSGRNLPDLEPPSYEEPIWGNGQQTSSLLASGQLIAEGLHPRDQEKLLALFPGMVEVQKNIAIRDFCRMQQIKLSDAIN